MYYRIDRKGNVVTITDSPENHTHVYYTSLEEAIKARAEEFSKQIPEPFKLLLEYDEAHDCFNVMTKNPKSSFGKGYRPLLKKRPSVFVRKYEVEKLLKIFCKLHIEYVVED